MNINNSNLSYKDLLLWREKEKIWEALESSGKTDINKTISVNFNLFKERIQVKATLTKPTLTTDSKIDFGSIQFGELAARNITVHNPSDEPLHIQFLLAPSEFLDNSNMSVFNKIIPDNLKEVNDFILLTCLFNMKRVPSDERTTYQDISQSEE